MIVGRFDHIHDQADRHDSQPAATGFPRGNLGASYLGGGRCRFVVWAPHARGVDVHVITPQEQVVPMERDSRGYYHVTADSVEPGALYYYRLRQENEEKERPDPASRLQPQGVHGPSQVVDPSFRWEDSSWQGLPLSAYIIYELHVGTFTRQGTFDAIIPLLDELKDLGITTLELMPVAQFPGSRNWGYDGVYPFAVQMSYGGPEGLQRLVNACHQRGLAVVLDVVYNHLGPEGNYLADFGPYFTDSYRTPWGSAINFDGPGSDEVRRFFIENAVSWLSEFHLDALRLDAIHAIKDLSAQPFLQELSIAIRHLSERLGQPRYLIAESDLNDARVIRPRRLGGFGLDAQWNDDFHHALHTLLTRERDGYYVDFGRLEHLATAFRQGYVYAGQYSAFRRRRHGNTPLLNGAQQFVVCSQNHDQIGNRMCGDRLSQLVHFDALKLAAGVVLLSPFVPLLFMGEEYGEIAPFQYFTSHTDPTLVEAVRRGRQAEFANFQWSGTVPDPQDEATFQRSKLDREMSKQGQHLVLLAFYRELIHLRKRLPTLTNLSTDDLEVVSFEVERVLFVRERNADDEVALVFSFGDAPITTSLPFPEGRWRKQLDSAEQKWQGIESRVPDELDARGAITLTLSPRAVVVFARLWES
ncbi:MAG: malto-oligosyltrehalose trehalohydrolase [Chloroflexota bacterium]|nr:MAG: malto-oligosyltrehalose trehalohydrolase [Chloroflexota bacterium]